MATSNAISQIRLPNILSDGAVLQRNTRITLWGWANPAEKLSVIASWSKDTVKTVTQNSSRWELNINTPEAGGPYEIKIIGTGTDSVTLHNIWLGEVWVCSGQSNMEFTYNWRKTKDVAADFATCNQYQLHFFKIPKTSSNYPQDNCGGSWADCDSGTLKDFSAVAYFFGKKLNKNLHVPVGLISSNWGGTPAEVWTPDSIVNHTPLLKQWYGKLRNHPNWPITPGVLYNAMIYPITQLNIQGAIWYQGESNVDNYGSYAVLFKDMILSWREAWKKELPFYYVQIAPYKYPVRNGGAYVRQAQTKALELPTTGMVITSDIVGDTNDIHPHDKHDVGYRLAEIALNKTYGLKQFNHFSPMYDSAYIKDKKVYIILINATAGLYSKGAIQDLYVAGKDSIYHIITEVKLEKNEIIISDKDVIQPVYIKYGFDNTRMGNIFNNYGLPLAPFLVRLKGY